MPPRVFQVEVPLLSLVPIPALQIKYAELEYYAKILQTPRSTVRKNTIQSALPPSEKEAQSGSAAAADTGSPTPTTSLPEFRRVDFKARLGQGPGTARDTGRRESSLEMQMHIKVRMEQADVPAGLSRLFNLMEHSISNKEITEGSGSQP